MYSKGTSPKVTDGHPLWIDDKWQTADKLGWESEMMYVDNLYYLQTDDNYIIFGGIPATGVLQENHPGNSIKNKGEV